MESEEEKKIKTERKKINIWRFEKTFSFGCTFQFTEMEEEDDQEYEVTAFSLCNNVPCVGGRARATRILRQLEPRNYYFVDDW